MIYSRAATPNTPQARLLDTPLTPAYSITIENIQLQNGFDSFGSVIYTIRSGSTNTWTNVVVKNCGCDNRGCIAFGENATGTWKSVTIDGVTGNALYGPVWYVQDSVWRFEDITIKNIRPLNIASAYESLFLVFSYSGVYAPLTFAGTITFSNIYTSAIHRYPSNSIFHIVAQDSASRQYIFSDRAKPSNFVIQNTNRTSVFYVTKGTAPSLDAHIQYGSLSITNAPLSSNAFSTYVFNVRDNCGNITISGGAMTTSGYGILYAESPVSLNLGIVTVDNTAIDNTAKTITPYAILAYAPVIMNTKAIHILNFMKPIVNNFADTATNTWPSPSIAGTTRPYALRLSATAGPVNIVNCGLRGIEMAENAFVLITASGLFNLSGCVSTSAESAGVSVPKNSTFSVSANRIVFQGNRVTGSSSTGGGAAASVANLAKFNLISATSISFISNLANSGSAGGGALLVRAGGSVSLSANSGVTFSGNQATLGTGGAVRLEGSGVMTFTKKTTVSFTSNVARGGSALSGTSTALTSLISQSTTVTATSNSDTAGTSCLFYLGAGVCPTPAQRNGISGSGNSGYDAGTCDNMMPLCSFSIVPTPPTAPPVTPPHAPPVAPPITPPITPIAPPVTPPITPVTPPITPPVTTPVESPAEPVASSVEPIEPPVEPVFSPVPEEVPTLAPIAPEPHEESNPPPSTANSLAIPIFLVTSLLLLSQIAF